MNFVENALKFYLISSCLPRYKPKVFFLNLSMYAPCTEKTGLIFMTAIALRMTAIRNSISALFKYMISVYLKGSRDINQKWTW